MLLFSKGFGKKFNKGGVMLMSSGKKNTLFRCFLGLLCFLLKQIFGLLCFLLKQIFKFITRKLKWKTHDTEISELPDEVLGHILSFLPTKSAVKTSILSKRWFCVWTFTSVLRFNREEFARVEGFVSFVNQVLEACKGSDIQTFALEWKQQFNELMVTEWLEYAVMWKIRELRLDIQPKTTGFSLPAWLFHCPSLQVCYVNAPWNVKPLCMEGRWEVTYCASSIMRLPSSFNLIQLKVLTLHWVTNHDDLLGKLISCSPVLERLSMNVRYDLHISAPNLKRLSLSCDRTPKIFKVHMVTPRLEIFDLIVVNLPEISLGVLQNLVSARIWKTTSNDIDENRFFALMQCLGHARKLQLEGDILKVMTKNLGLFSALRLDNLISLKMDALLNKDGIQTIITLLKSCPSLERLLIHNVKVNLITSEDHWTPSKELNKFILQKLRDIEIKSFTGDENEFNFVEFLLQKGIGLEKIKCKMESQDRGNLKRISQRLLAISRASPAIIIPVL